jgi:YVTN family beta-propeller protein
VVGAVIPVGLTNPNAIAYNFINNLLYVTKGPTNNMVIIDAATNIVLSTVPLGSITPTGVVYNSNDNSIWITFNGGSNVQSFLPITPPVVVINGNGGYNLSEIFKDLVGKPFVIAGLKMIVESLEQLRNNITVSYITVTGSNFATFFQPLNYVSPSCPNDLIIDAADFEVEVNGDTQVTLDIDPLSSLILSITIKASVDNTIPLFKNIVGNWGVVTDASDVVRGTGNVIADMIFAQRAEKILADSNYQSVAQYATYPELTGNPIVDAVLLNQAGFKYDH